MRAIRGYIAALVAALTAEGVLQSKTPAMATNSTDVIIQLRVAGDIEALRPIQSCLAEKLARMPDVKVATVSTDGTRFVVDIVATKNATKKISASVVVAEIFPMEQYTILHFASAARGRSSPIARNTLFERRCRHRR